ncbi:hypothetical protein K492DRAFT_142647 [Lichtheimia hyalospora FSU 10163]|nr:hypothetical protein K492DRAFT_142647 [Lichtheimia hyalospora FSU 10163]
MTTAGTNGSEQENTEPISTSSPAPPIAVPETPVARLLGNRAKSRSRASSMSVQQDTAAPAAVNDTAYDSDVSSEGEAMSTGLSQPAPGSIAAACHLEVANDKRNQEFHQLFRSVPENDPLIEDFGCALQKEILLQGRIYISENHLCFNANIFGWVTNLVIAFADIVDIEKRTTALFIPNAIQVSTLQAKHFFASFLSRDQAYDLLLDVWRQSRPQPDPSKSLDDDDDDDEKNSSEQENDNESMDESDTSSGDYTYVDVEDGASVSSNQDEPMNDAQVPDNAVQQSTITDDPAPTDRNNVSGEHTPHTKTQCACDDHYTKTVLETTFPCTLQTLYSLLYEGSFMKSFLQDQKNTDIDMGEWQTGQGSIDFTRDVSYTKPLYGAIGPKSTRCLLKEEIYHKDLDDYVTEITTTQTPDVPSGGSFSIKTKTCLTWSDNDQTHMLVTVLVDFTKSSWIKSTIESASISGQEDFYKALSETINQKLSESHPKKAQGKKKKLKRKKVKKRRKHADMDTNHETFLAKISSLLSNGYRVAKQLPTPSTSFISVLCMMLLVLLNVYMARKMSLVDTRLESLYDEMHRSIGSPASTQDNRMKGSRQDTGRAKQEEEDLWSWLGTIDIEKDPRMTVIEEPNMKHEKGDAHDEEDDVSSEYLQDTLLAKEKLDQHMTDIEDMIHRAGSRIGNVNHVVEFQRQRILQDISKNSS